VIFGINKLKSHFTKPGSITALLKEFYKIIRINGFSFSILTHVTIHEQ